MINASVQESPEVINYALFQQQDIPELADRGSKDRGLAVGSVLSMAGKGVMMLINMERRKYTASYEQALTDLVFYDQLSDKNTFDPVGMQFNGFEVTRMVKTSARTTDTAFYAAFEPDLSNPYELINNSFFRLKLKDIKINYAKAKVSGTRWYIPWSWGGKKKKNKLNIDIEIVFRATWVTEDGHFYNNVEIGRFLLPLRDVPLHPDDPGREAYFEALKDKVLVGKSSLVPRSYGYYYSGGSRLQACYGQGLYSIETQVRESGTQNFVLKMTNKVQTFVRENKGN